MPQSIKLHQLQVNPQDSQFIEAMRFSDEELARFFGVSSAMADIVVSGTSLTYSNITDRREDFKQFTLLLPMHRLEEAMTELIPRPQEVVFNPAGLLKGSITERYATYKTAAEINNLTGDTFMSVEEMREFEDWEPLPEDDEPEVEPTPAAPAVDESDDGERSRRGLDEQTIRQIISDALRAPERQASGDTHIHLPDSLQVEMRQDPIIVPAPIVNVPAAQVTVNVEPTPVSVNVAVPEQPAPVVNVAAPSVSVPAPVVTVVDNDSGAKSVKFRRNDKGQIVSAEVSD